MQEYNHRDENRHMLKLIMRTTEKEGRFYDSIIFNDSYLLLHLNKPGWTTAKHSGFYWDCPLALGEILNIHLYIIAPRLPSILTLYIFLDTQNARLQLFLH